MMSILEVCAISMLLALSGPDIRAGDSFSIQPPDDRPMRGVELFAARGESESVLLWLANDGAERILEACTLTWPADLTLPVHVYDAGPVAPSGEIGNLAPFAPLQLAPEATRHLLFRIDVPANAPSGRSDGEIRLRFDDGSTLDRAVTLEVFDFVLPAIPSLPVLLGMDHAAMKSACGLSESLDDWRAVYDMLAAARVGFQVWPERAPWDGVFYDYRDIDLIKDHLGYAATLPGLPVLALGGQAGELLERWPPPVLNSPQDALQFLLFSVMATLEGNGWTRPAIVIPKTMPSRDDWQAIRQAYARVERADERVTRLLAGPPHPFFERYTDIWALPESTPCYALSLLEAGLSLVRYAQPAAAHSGTPGSQDDSGTYTTEPGDAFDGCETTLWIPDGATEEAPPWLDATFAEPLLLESLAIVQPEEAGATPPTVETAYQPGAYTRATVRWDMTSAWSEGELAVHHGVFKYPRECLAIRLTFEPDAGRRQAVAEVLFNQDGRSTLRTTGDPVRAWLDLRSTPLVSASALPGGLAGRLAPWRCWQQGFTGILGPVLNPGGGTGAQQLLSCGPGGAQPAAALFHLSDGLEDYEFLRLYWKAVGEGAITPPAHLQPGALPSVRDAESATQALALMQDQRVQMGRLLSGQSIVTRNFGPRR